MITILYPYRNRELERIKISLDSLLQQRNTDFKVLFVDYGTDEALKKAIKLLLSTYNFVAYTESYTSFQPWSRAKAINVGLRKVNTEYVFIADIDMIFRSDFIEKLQIVKAPNKAIFFKVGFLSESETRLNKDFSNYVVQFYSGYGAQGLSLFSMKQLIDVNGFDEFFHFWGAEDEDIHNRLQLAGFESIFYEQEILMLHRWHSTYRASEKKSLTKDFQLSNISRINQKHQIFNKTKKIQKANHEKWGNPLKEAEFNELENCTGLEQLLNIKSDIDHFLFYELPNLNKGILKIIIKEDKFNKTIKYKVKKFLGKKVPNYYSLKKINDKLLLHIISFYHPYPYYYKVSDDLKSIVFKIKK
jgi:hypothetical protein